MNSFRALFVDKAGNEAEVAIHTRQIHLNDLPGGELVIQVAYSSVNYKDALACKADGNIVRNYPFIPGIDLAGTVISSQNDRFQAGDEVIVTSYGLGVSHYGGFSEIARVPAEWALKLPAGLSLKEAMLVGTAGFTAALSVMEIEENGIKPGSGPILVTGATGGVGSMAVSMLAKLGYEVIASTGKADMREELLRLGAAQVIARDELLSGRIRSLDKQRWAGAVDCVGGLTLASILPGIQYGGVVAASGLTGGTDVDTSVFPFILRAVRLIGIDSVMAPMARREQVWQRIANTLKPSLEENLHEEISLEQVKDYVPIILAGQSKGRVLVRL
ncbi:oxidoreductase [Paenibacillus solisilvae]|uniref:Oxidoreductase n=1 Tax=Paenibacillus solisilvae TaxID=2486751 RepID=A0ABW0W8T7_9BACL